MSGGGWAAAAQVAGDIGSQIGGSWLNNRYALQRQHDSENFDQMMYSQRYQIQVKDLKAAGLNPMLAYTQGPGPGPSVSPAGAAPGEGGLGSRGVAAYNTTRLASAEEAQRNSITANTVADTAKKTKEAELVESQRKLTDASTLTQLGLPVLNAALATQATSSAENYQAMTQHVSWQIEQTKNEIEKIQATTKNIEKDTEVKDTIKQLNKRLGDLYITQMYLNQHSTQQKELENAILSPKAYAAGTHSAKVGAVADNIGKLGTTIWKFLFPTMGGGETTQIGF